MTLDFGKGIKFKTVFVIVQNLGVPALLGTRTMGRVGIDICFTAPQRIECLGPNGGPRVIFPLKLGKGQSTLQSFVTTYEDQISEAISKAEAPVTASSKIFDSRAGEKDLSSC